MADQPITAPGVPSPPEDRPPVPWMWRDLMLALILGFVAGAVAIGILLAVFPGIDDLETTRWLLLVGGSIYAFELLFAWYVAIRRRGAKLRDAGVVMPTMGAVLLMGPAIIGVFLVEGAVAQVVVNLFGPTPTAEDQLLGGEGGLDRSQIPWVLLLTVVIAPIVEEFFFRGLLYGYLRSRMSVKAAAPVSALLFAVLHFTPLLIPSLVVLGIALALVYERYKSLVVPMVLHALNNGIVIWALYSTV